MNIEHEKVTYLYPHSEEQVSQVTPENTTGVGRRFIRKTIHLVKVIVGMVVWFFFTMLKPLSALLAILSFAGFWVTVFMTIYKPEFQNFKMFAMSFILFLIALIPFFVTDKLEGK